MSDEPIIPITQEEQSDIPDTPKKRVYKKKATQVTENSQFNNLVSELNKILDAHKERHTELKSSLLQIDLLLKKVTNS